MRIIKNGVVKDEKKIFECPRCGCIFEAGILEYSTMFACHVPYYATCDCPCCGMGSCEIKYQGDEKQEYTDKVEPDIWNNMPWHS